MKKLIPVTIMLIAWLASAQNYSMDWSAIGGGGATASGGPYSLASTIGQTAVGGPASGGPYEANTGFWEVPGGPELTIRFTAPDTIVISWPATALGCFALQETASLNASQWEDMANPVTFADGVDQVTVTLTGKTQYYRLISPCQ
jgi:hypothetical protein